jgi:uroporphyrinogen decarboxylase
MNSRERILAAIRHEPLDRIPTDIWATPEVMAKLQAYFGTGADLHALLHIDGIPYIWPRYAGPALPAMPAGESIDYWGMRHRRIDYGTGAYMEQSFAPLATAQTIDDLERYPWPTADWFDYSGLAAQAHHCRETHAVMAGYIAPFYYHNLLRGLEMSLMDPLDDPAFTHHLLGRLCDFFYEHHRRLFESAEGLIDICQVTDDYGSQTGTLIGLDTFREFYRPHLQRFIELCHSFGIAVFHHDDGAMRPFLPDLVEVGIDVLNPVQWNCPGMELAPLKRDFGPRICFHGGIENQQILPFGTPEEVRAEVRHCIDNLASDGTGYILAPCHNLQPVTPVENILAMYDEAYLYGKLH